MIRQIDQSRKFEQTSGDTVIACANDIQYSIRIPAKVKREVIRSALAQGKKSLKQIVFACYAAGIYLVLCETGSPNRRVVIDQEYEGHEPTIKAMILRHFQKAGINFTPEAISFGLVGKDSPAHHLAWSVYRGRQTANRVITYTELLALIK